MLQYIGRIKSKNSVWQGRIQDLGGGGVAKQLATKPLSLIVSVSDPDTVVFRIRNPVPGSYRKI